MKRAIIKSAILITVIVGAPVATNFVRQAGNSENIKQIKQAKSARYVKPDTQSTTIENMMEFNIYNFEADKGELDLHWKITDEGWESAVYSTTGGDAAQIEKVEINLVGEDATSYNLMENGQLNDWKVGYDMDGNLVTPPYANTASEPALNVQGKNVYPVRDYAYEGTVHVRNIPMGTRFSGLTYKVYLSSYDRVTEYDEAHVQSGWYTTYLTDEGVNLFDTYDAGHYGGHLLEVNDDPNTPPSNAEELLANWDDSGVTYADGFSKEDVGVTYYYGNQGVYGADYAAQTEGKAFGETTLVKFGTAPNIKDENGNKFSEIVRTSDPVVGKPEFTIGNSTSAEFITAGDADYETGTVPITFHYTVNEDPINSDGTIALNALKSEITSVEFISESNGFSLVTSEGGEITIADFDDINDTPLGHYTNTITGEVYDEWSADPTYTVIPTEYDTEILLPDGSDFSDAQLVVNYNENVELMSGYSSKQDGVIDVPFIYNGKIPHTNTITLEMPDFETPVALADATAPEVTFTDVVADGPTEAHTDFVIKANNDDEAYFDAIITGIVISGAPFTGDVTLDESFFSDGAHTLKFTDEEVETTTVKDTLQGNFIAGETYSDLQLKITYQYNLAGEVDSETYDLPDLVMSPKNTQKIEDMDIGDEATNIKAKSFDINWSFTTAQAGDSDTYDVTPKFIEFYDDSNDYGSIDLTTITPDASGVYSGTYTVEGIGSFNENTGIFTKTMDLTSETEYSPRAKVYYDNGIEIDFDISESFVVETSALKDPKIPTLDVDDFESSSTTTTANITFANETLKDFDETTDTKGIVIESANISSTMHPELNSTAITIDQTTGMGSFDLVGLDSETEYSDLKLAITYHFVKDGKSLTSVTTSPINVPTFETLPKVVASAPTISSFTIADNVVATTNTLTVNFSDPTLIDLPESDASYGRDITKVMASSVTAGYNEEVTLTNGVGSFTMKGLKSGTDYSDVELSVEWSSSKNNVVNVETPIVLTAPTLTTNTKNIPDVPIVGTVITDFEQNTGTITFSDPSLHNVEEGETTMGLTLTNATLTSDKHPEVTSTLEWDEESNTGIFTMSGLTSDTTYDDFNINITYNNILNGTPADNPGNFDVAVNSFTTLSKNVIEPTIDRITFKQGVVSEEGILTIKGNHLKDSVSEINPGADAGLTIGDRSVTVDGATTSLLMDTDTEIQISLSGLVPGEEYTANVSLAYDIITDGVSSIGEEVLTHTKTFKNGLAENLTVDETTATVSGNEATFAITFNENLSEDTTKFYDGAQISYYEKEFTTINEVVTEGNTVNFNVTGLEEGASYEKDGWSIALHQNENPIQDLWLTSGFKTDYAAEAFLVEEYGINMLDNSFKGGSFTAQLMFKGTSIGENGLNDIAIMADGAEFSTEFVSQTIFGANTLATFNVSGLSETTTYTNWQVKALNPDYLGTATKDYYDEEHMLTSAVTLHQYTVDPSTNIPIDHNGNVLTDLENIGTVNGVFNNTDGELNSLIKHVGDKLTITQWRDGTYTANINTDTKQEFTIDVNESRLNTITDIEGNKTGMLVPGPDSDGNGDSDGWSILSPLESVDIIEQTISNFGGGLNLYRNKQANWSWDMLIQDENGNNGFDLNEDGFVDIVSTGGLIDSDGDGNIDAIDTDGDWDPDVTNEVADPTKPTGYANEAIVDTENGMTVDIESITASSFEFAITIDGNITATDAQEFKDVKFYYNGEQMITELKGSLGNQFTYEVSGLTSDTLYSKDGWTITSLPADYLNSHVSARATSDVSKASDEYTEADIQLSDEVRTLLELAEPTGSSSIWWIITLVLLTLTLIGLIFVIIFLLRKTTLAKK